MEENQYKQHLRLLKLKIYKLYKDDFIECPFCSRSINLNNSKSHLKTKKCLHLQSLFDKEKYDELILAYYQNINKIKSDLRLSV